MTSPIVRRRRAVTKFNAQGTEALYFRSANNKFYKNRNTQARSVFKTEARISSSA
jgi:hypothetical protein